MPTIRKKSDARREMIVCRSLWPSRCYAKDEPSRKFTALEDARTYARSKGFSGIKIEFV